MTRAGNVAVQEDGWYGSTWSKLKKRRLCIFKRKQLREFVSSTNVLTKQTT